MLTLAASTTDFLGNDPVQHYLTNWDTGMWIWMVILALGLFVVSAFLSNVVPEGANPGPAVLLNVPMMLYGTWPLYLIIRHLSQPTATWVIVSSFAAFVVGLVIRYRVYGTLPWISIGCAIAIHAGVYSVDRLARNLAGIPVGWQTVGTVFILIVCIALAGSLKKR